MRLVLEQSFGAENEPYEAILEAISGRIAVDGAGNLYIVVRGPRLIGFGPDGSFRWAVERQGDVTVEEYGEVGAPLRLRSGHWLVHARWPVGLDDPDEHARLQALDQAPPLTFGSRGRLDGGVLDISTLCTDFQYTLRRLSGPNLSPRPETRREKP